MELQNENSSQPLTTQGDATEQEENMGGTTNLSLDQLKKEGGVAEPDEDNPNRIADPDDLHEIQAGDDLDEPDLDDEQPDAPIPDEEMNEENAANPENNI